MVDIFIYGDIGESWWDDESITGKTIAAQLAGIAPTTPINLRINSAGGDVSEALAIFNLLKPRREYLTSYIDGYALSAASLIALASDRVISPESSIWMIHNPSTITYGDARSHRAAADALDTHRDAILSIYASATGKSREEIIAALDAETWMTGSEAKEWGLATETIESAPVENVLPRRFAASASAPKEKLKSIGWSFAATATPARQGSPRQNIQSPVTKTTMNKEQELQSALDRANARIGELESTVTNARVDSAEVERVNARFEAVSAELEKIKMRQQVSDRYYNLRQRAEKLVASAQLTRADFAEDFTDSPAADIEKLFAADDREITMAVIERTLVKAEKRSPILPTNLGSAAVEGRLNDPDRPATPSSESVDEFAARMVNSLGRVGI